MTLNELINDLSDLAGQLGDAADTTPVRLATQPSYPLEYSIRGVALVIDDDGDTSTAVYIGEGTQLGYLPSGVREEVWG
jgi:hypothetical protein